jgi:D-psicose/D-tagatose/L-ribulose 3-epimerase
MAAAAQTSAADVQVGRCAGISKLEETKAAGFDFAEIGVRDIAKLSDEDFAKALATHKQVGLPTPVANVFLPGELKVVGPAIDKAAQMAYVTKAFDRMQQFGVKIIVFGSGGSRKVPDGFSKDEAFAQLVEFAQRIAPEAQKRDIVLAVEPLRQQETNIINTAAEGLKWVQAVGHPNFQLMVDFYHLAIEKEDPSILVRARDHIKHFHIANPNDRVFPLDANEYDYSGFFANLRQMGFKGGISVEAKHRAPFAEEGPKALSFIRNALASGVSAPSSTPAAAAAAQ